MDQALKQSHIQRYKHMQRKELLTFLGFIISLAVFRTDSEIHHLIFASTTSSWMGGALELSEGAIQVTKAWRVQSRLCWKGLIPSSYIYWLLRKNKRKPRIIETLSEWVRAAYVNSEEGFLKKGYVLNEFIFKLDEEMTRALQMLRKIT